MVWALGVLVALILVTVIFLRGSDFSRYDKPPGQSFDAGHEPSDEHDAVVASLDVGAGPIQRAPRRQRLALGDFLCECDRQSRHGAGGRLAGAEGE